MILVQRHITQARIYLSFYAFSYLFIHISSISSGCIYISESEKENVIIQNMLFIFIIFLSFLVCFVTCTIFSICLNLSSMSAWISVLQGFVAVVQFFCTFLFLGCPK